ncbi:hypothetical protein Glove_535g8 [Diversispora epigaea]|uniref:Uncharacterized protein n=1 Tax=Diversispora epigaea TaxID=1348612 RepID=A0A397GH35_9GLOM|nr:hypothetical protein Glove_535g8 [Diversispora epigaea]
MQIVGDAIQSFLPLFSTVTSVVDGLYTTYDNVKCNKKICLALIDRVEIVQQAVKSLICQCVENYQKISDEISQQTVFQKFLNANTVKEAFDKNINEFEAEQREQENVMNDIKEDMKNVLKEVNLLWNIPLN